MSDPNGDLPGGGATEATKITIRGGAPGAPDPKAQQVPESTNWVDCLKDWAYQLTVLKVATFVGDAEITPDAQGIPRDIVFTKGGAALYTVCDLIGGDITNVIPAQYLENAGLRTFHAQQVAAAAAILPNNLKVLGDLVGSVLR